MKPFLVFILVITCTIACGQTVTGYVIDQDSQKPLARADIFLTENRTTPDSVNICYWQYSKYSIIAKTRSDSFGYFTFSNLPKNTYNVIAVYDMPKLEKLGGMSGVRDDIDSNLVLTNGVHRTKTFKLMATCPYDKTKDLASCPKCKKSNKVKPILYGLPLYSEEKNYFEKYHFAGCVMDAYCNPAKYCERCELGF